jgi:tetratricopeptide (TPR) repeat protein
MRSHLFALIFIGWLFSFQVNAGVKEYDSLVVYHYQKAQQWMRLGVYDSAHAEFKKLFKLEMTIPDEAAFYYGINQFQRKKYKYAKQGFEKYLKLRGDSATWSDSSQSYIERIDCMEIAVHVRCDIRRRRRVDVHGAEDRRVEIRGFLSFFTDAHLERAIGIRLQARETFVTCVLERGERRERNTFRFQYVLVPVPRVDEWTAVERRVDADAHAASAGRRTHSARRR